MCLQRRVMAGHDNVYNELLLAPQNGGMLTDGMGSGGHGASRSAPDSATVQASAGQQAQLDLYALWMHQGNQLRVTVDDGEEVLLRGTVLPPADGGGRQFRSKLGGKIKVMLVTDELGSLSFFSLAVSAVCADAWRMLAWNETVPAASHGVPCHVPSPTDFAYPSSDYAVQTMLMNRSFVPAADAWSQAKDEFDHTYRYRSGVLLPDGRVVLVPDNANRVGLYDPRTDEWSQGKDQWDHLSIKYQGGVLLPDGRVVLVPATANHVGLYDPQTDTWTEGKDDLSERGGSYYGGVLLPDGRVAFVPHDARRVGLYDPRTDTWTEGKDTRPAKSGIYSSGMLLPDGRVLFVPGWGARIGLYDPSMDEWTDGQDDIGAKISGYKYYGGVLLPDGRVVLVPGPSHHVGLYDPHTDTWTEGRDTTPGGLPNLYNGGVLLPDGRVLLVPYDGIRVGLYDPSADTFTQGKDSLPDTVGKYAGGVLVPDGRVVLVPANAARVGLYDAGGTRNGGAYTVPALSPATNALLLPYYNKL
jgi:hypothetical protein